MGGLLGRAAGAVTGASLPWILLGLAIAAVMIAGVSYTKGYGHASAQAELRIARLQSEHAAAVRREQQRQLDVAAAVRRAAEQRINKILDERDALAGQLEDMANEALDDPAADRVGLSADGVRRLNRLAPAGDRAAGG